MSLPEQIVAQVKWLAENLGHPEAKIAACALADEILALVASPENYRSRETVEHERQVLLGYLKEAYRLCPMSFEGGRGSSIELIAKALETICGMPTPKVVVSIDRDRMNELDRVQAQEELFSALVQMGWSHTELGNRIWGDGERFEVIRMVPPPEFRIHLFDSDRVCQRCGTSMMNANAASGRLCPGQITTRVQGINRAEAEQHRIPGQERSRGEGQAERRRQWLEGSGDPNAE